MKSPLNLRVMSLCIGVGVLASQGYGVASPKPAKVAPIPSGVAGLIRRVTPGASANFRVENLPSQGGERFEIRGDNGKVVLRGSTPIAQASAYGWYLKHVANAHLSWGGDQTKLPARLPLPLAPLQISTPYPKRHALNYCMLSYTAAFWDWNRWQREIDFLALNGFNQVLVTAGMEKVWLQTLRDLGYPEDKIKQYIASPAYAAWWHMGNLEGMGGPMSDAEIENEARLGRQIVVRMRELGITPVLTGFVGLLPNDIGDYVPDLKPDLLPQGMWVSGYQRPIVLKPTSAQFPRVAALWYKNLHQVYGGHTSAYGGDLFHEGGRPGNTPLGEAAKSVQTAMQVASPNSIWVLQGWQGNPSPQLLAGLDPKKTQVLQLCRDMKEGTNGAPLRTYDGMPWLWGELANFGGKVGLYGGMPLMEKLPNFLLDPTKGRGNLQGVGLLSEGIEQNPLYYDLFFDDIWRSKDVQLGSWLDGYETRRYGAKNATARKALQLLMESGVYSPTGLQEGPTESILCAKPARDARKASSWSSGKVYYDTDKITQAAQTLLQAAPQFKAQETYRYDLVDWTRQAIAELARPTLADAMAAYDRKDIPAFNRYTAQYLELLRDSDRLLASERHWLLGVWIARAKAKGTTPTEKALMEQNARTLVTTWSGKIDELNDYAHRQWAGLMRDYYLPRWQAFFDDHRAVLEGKLPAAQLNNWYNTRRAGADIAFAKATTTYPTTAQGDTVAIARELLAKYAPLSSEYARIARQTTGFRWKLAEGVAQFKFDVNETVLQAGTYQATFQWEDGDSALKIHSVALYEGEKKVAEDTHEGWTGIENRQNSFLLELPKLRTGLESYTLRAQVEGASSLNSAGTLKFVRVK
ncbi:alpha-N-acetylglucosaminidase [bacterium]|nr:MAG: alpha-N-acetylglucosaminidase [bacterium]